MKPKITICMPAQKTINVFVAQCLFNAIRVLKQYDMKVIIDNSFGVDNARNNLVKKSIDADYLMFIDSDVCFNPKNIRQLVSHNKDIVSGVYFKRGFPYHPHVYMLKKGTNGYEWVTGKLKGLQEVDAVGFGFILIKRKVFDKLKKPYFLIDLIKPLGEDIYFCKCAQKAGYKIHLDCDVQLGHLTNRVITINDWKKVRPGVKI